VESLVRHGSKKERGFSLIELMLVVAILGIVSSIAVPNFLRYQAQARQSEARNNLGGVFVAQMAFFGENGRFSDFTEIGFALAGAGNRYTYRAQRTTQAGTTVTAGAVQMILATAGNVEVDNLTVPVGSTALGFTATASANLDGDLTLDQWHVNDLKINLRSPDSNDVGS
jgi:prepilin-type N-terminal cleavage/methylation domain-containing protein